jgi:hypothetical protein
VRVTPLPYCVVRLTGLASHEGSLWLRPRDAETLTVRGIELTNTGDTLDVAGISAEVWMPPSKLDEWKQGRAE